MAKQEIETRIELDLTEEQRDLLRSHGVDTESLTVHLTEDDVKKLKTQVKLPPIDLVCW